MANPRWINRSNKYSAKKTEVDGIMFASKAEAHRYGELKILKSAGEITDLVLQPRFDIDVNGKRICFYKADFQYFDVKKQKKIIEDVKGMINPYYRLKRKLTEAVHGIEIVEIKRSRRTKRGRK